MGLEHVMICTYLRKDLKEMERKKEYQYVDEVTVSTVQELVEAIQSRTKIILKEGTYNFSELDCDSIKNPNIENESLIKSIDIVGIWIYDEIQIEIAGRVYGAKCAESMSRSRGRCQSRNQYGKFLCESIRI